MIEHDGAGGAIDAAVEALSEGRMAVVVDDPGRENEGDLVLAARHATRETINFMAIHGRGLICVAMLRERLGQLAIPPMVQQPSDPQGTAFHVGVDLRGQAIGISAGERAQTICALADPASTAADFTRPGHVFPLVYRPGRVLERAGHTEASIDLTMLAGAGPAAVICEITARDGEMMRQPELLSFAERHRLPLVTVGELVERRSRARRLVRRMSQARVPLEAGTFTVVGYLDTVDGREHIAAVYGDVAGRRGVLARVRSEWLTGDVLGSRRCDCGLQLQAALQAIRDAGSGVLVYLLAINYTSGSTGRPKGVMYSHRGAYLQGLAMADHCSFGFGPVYLWTLPMFHCNGWACTWAVTPGGGTHLCLRRIDAAEIWEEICTRDVTRLSGAPTVLAMIAEAADAAPALRPHRAVAAATGGAPPSPALLERLARLKIEVTHFYGLTETYGPAVINQWQPEWSDRPAEERARLNARQGIANVVTAGLSVLGEQGREVPADGQTMGEIVLRGNNVMLGYYRDEEATAAAAFDGWFRTGDLGVRHTDGYIELRDRAKDVIISGGENIASVEIEQILCRHPAVLEAADVGRPDPRWGEVPVAFVALRAGHAPEPRELIEFVRVHTARFKAPKAVIFTELPKTSTGKVEKHRLRAELRAAAGA